MEASNNAETAIAKHGTKKGSRESIKGKDGEEEDQVSEIVWAGECSGAYIGITHVMQSEPFIS